MKKIISILISVCLILTVIVPSVFAYKQTSFSVSNVIQDDDTYLVTIKGTGEPSAFVSITVIPKNGVGYTALEQSVTNETGIFIKTFPVRNAGEYTAIVNNYKSNSRDTSDFRLYSKAELDAKVGEFKNADDIMEIQACITNYGTMFGLDTKYYTDESKDAVALEMLALKNSLTKENITEKFDEANLRAYIYRLSTDIEAVLEYYDSLTSIASSPVGMYGDYKVMEADEKARVYTTAFANPVTDITKLCERFYMAIVAEKISNCTNTEFDLFVSDYIGYLGIDGYDKISTVKKSKIIGVLKDSEIPDNTEDFAKLYKNIVEENVTDEPSKTPSTGGGGAGGGGGGSSAGPIVTDPTGFETTEVLNTPAPDVPAAITFTDLDGYSWAKEAITYLTEKGVVNGKSHDQFAPGDKITREEYAKIIVMAFGLYDEDAVCSFTDVSSDRWSYKYIASIYGFGAINGYPDGSFGASNPITREEMAVMLYRVMSKQMKIELLTEVKTSLKDYADIADFAKNSVITLNHNGIISGDDMGNFNPKNNATRAEVCQMIYNSLNREGGRK